MELTLCRLDELREMPDLIGLNGLGSLTIVCGSQPRGIGKLPSLLLT
jgi:hypothetical protein